MKGLHSINDEPLEALNQILDYLWDDEQNDYLRRDEEDREGHIFEALKSVRSWMDSVDTT